MKSSDEDDLIESNSSESSPPRESHQASDSNEPEPTNTNFDKLFEKFIEANTSKSICKCFQNMTNALEIDTRDVFDNGYSPAECVFSPYKFSHNSSFHNYHLQQQHLQQQEQLKNTRLVYQIIKSKTNYWKANTLWKTYDKLAGLKEYKRSAAGRDLHVLIIGGGPVGLRLSIECALLGLRCTVVEKRDKFSRNNVLHLWPYTIVDLKNLGAKMFYGKFCAGSIDHISKNNLLKKSVSNSLGGVLFHTA